MKIYRITKDIIFSVYGILLFIFSNLLMPYVDYVVGLSILLFVLEGLIDNIFEKEIFTKDTYIVSAILQAILIFILLYKGGVHEMGLVYTCLIWGTWSMVREGEEITLRVLRKIKSKPIKILNVLESIIVIALKVHMMIEPTYENLSFHLIILGAEMLLEVIWPQLDYLLLKYKQKRILRVIQND